MRKVRYNRRDHSITAMMRADPNFIDIPVELSPSPRGLPTSAHLAAVTPHCPYFEYLPAELTDSKLRQELVQDDLKLVDGKLAIPQKPGLGIEINTDALKRFSQD